MKYSVKRKIRLGTLFLFTLLLISGGISIYAFVRLKTDSKEILENNYESLSYGHAMQSAIDSLSIDRNSAILRIDHILKQQEANITEPGEQESTSTIRKSFERLRNGDSSSSAILEMSSAIQQTLLLNMKAIEMKNKKAADTAEDALTYITFISALIFLIGFTFAYNFPSVLTAPINTLTEGIRQIGRKNYTHRIHLDRKDEFGEMSESFNNMAERLEYFESSNLNKIIFEKTRAEAVINSLKDASIGIDKNNVILFAIDQPLQFLNLNANDVIGSQVDEISKRNDLFRFLLEEKGNLPFKIVVDNRENYFTKETIDIDQDGSTSRVIVLRNITSFKELDVAKTNFIATISHELKTPLASSDFSLKLLQDERIGQLSEEQKGLLQNLKDDNQRMLRILSELLNMAQVEAGRIQLSVSEVSPTSIADSAIDAISTTAREKNIKVIKNYPETVAKIKADKEKTGWVLNNFLTNAIKYSSQNMTISVSITQTSDSVEFVVTDQGPGISSEYLQKVFDRFFKVPGSTTHGTGLGLSISKEFIEAQGGKIWVKSDLGNGSSFGFNLPLS